MSQLPLNNKSGDESEIVLPFCKNAILIVDDEAINLFVLDKLLKKRGFRVDKRKNGLEAVEAVKNNEYELVLLDLMMPEMDGFEACKKICKLKPHLPVIILTAMVDDHSIAKSFENGAVDYIKKPLDEIELFSRLHNAIILKRAEERYVTMYKDMAKDLDTASEIQLGLLPSWFFLKDNLIATSLYEPSGKIGGDLFDILSLGEGKFIVYMGDISGHGVQAALLMASVKSFIHMLIGLKDPKLFSPHRFVTKLNSLIAQRFFHSHYLTFVFMLVDTKAKKVQICNAGHPPVFLYDKQKDKTHVIAQRGGFPLGWMPYQEYTKEEEETIDFDQDSSLFIYTDGIFECVDKGGEQLGIKGLKYFFKQSLRNHSTYLLPWFLKERLIKGSYNFGGDDFTLLYLQNKDWSKETNARIFSLLPSLSEVGTICQSCEKQVRKWTEDAAFSSQIELIVGEYLNNIIVHGMKEREDIPIFFEMSFDQDAACVKMYFFDCGVKWDLQKKMEEKEKQTKPDFQTSGYGLSIISRMAQSFTVNRICDVNETIITVSQSYPKV